MFSCLQAAHLATDKAGIPSDAKLHRTEVPAASIHGLGELYGVCIYAFMCHHSLPSIIAPLRDKSRVIRLFTLDCEWRHESP